MKGLAVLFDLDDTLIPERYSEREAMSMSGRAAGLDDQDANRLPDVLEPIGRAHWSALDRDGVFKEVSYTWREALWGPPCDEIGASAALLAAYRDATCADTCRAMGLRDARAAAQHFSEMIERLIAPFPGTEAVLAHISKRYLTALITNGSPTLQRHKLALSGLGSFFQTVVVSGDVRQGKPGPKPFLTALNAPNISPEQAIMVGNSKAADIEGANRLGIYSVLFIPPGGEPSIGDAWHLSAIFLAMTAASLAIAPLTGLYRLSRIAEA